MEKFNIELWKDHLIILSDLLHRISESKVLDDFIVDQSEIQVIWHLDWILEKITPNILSKSYLEELKDARNSYRHKD